MIPLRRALPELKVVFEHLTTREGVDYVRQAAGPVAATITAHHLLYNRNALFQGGIRPHWYCLPVLKREKHRQALIDAATSQSARSEERRVGKEWVSTCRSRWAANN